MEIYEIICYIKQALAGSVIMMSEDTTNLGYIKDTGRAFIDLASSEVPKIIKSSLDTGSGVGGVMSTLTSMFTNAMIFMFMIMVVLYILFSIIKSEGPDSRDSDTTLDADQGIFSNNSTKNKAQPYVPIKFADVAGLKEAKEEVQQYVDIIKNRNKYLKMGAKLPKGLLMVGPPGCGKTLLARAIAGEAGVNFIACTGSDFDEMYVGVGSSRVRNLFKRAREQAPCIIFIDEIDGVGGKRGHHENKEGDKTLNAVLTQMDGFDSSCNVLVIGATNRLDTLDEALKRSGRFDRHCVVDLPTIDGRREIFALYIKKLKLEDAATPEERDKNVQSLANDMAKMTPGVSPADIANICNQAAMIAVDANCEFITKEHLKRAVEDVCIGGQRKSRKVSEKEKHIVAYHECGHAILGYILQHTGAPQIISCIPRGAGNLGYTLPEHDDEMLRNKPKMIEEICVLFGGTAAEDIFFNGHVTNGASDDIRRATNIAYEMCTQYGMSEQLGKIQMGIEKGGRESGGIKMSDATMTRVDAVVKKLTDEIYVKAKEFIIKHKDSVEILAKCLLEKEEIRTEKIEELLGCKNIKNSQTLSTIKF